MAHVLHDGHHQEDAERDFGGKGDHDGDCTGNAAAEQRNRRRRRRRRERLIDVGNISIDCTPVSFRTPGQALSVVSCAVSQTLMVPVTRTVNVQQPTDFGCMICTPVTETVQVPVTATVNMPPVLVPVPRVVCPENVLCSQVCAPAEVQAATKPCGCR